MHRTRWIRLMLALAALLAATTPVGAAASAPSAQTDPGETGTRPYEHAFRTTEIPREPRRVVVAQHAFLEAFLELGVPVVGAVQDQSPAAGLETGFSLADPGAYDVTGIASVGTADQPNLEAVAALDPDLIFVDGNEYFRPLYDQLARIAPTVAPPVTDAPSARAAVAMIAELTGTTDRLAALDAGYEENLAGLRERVAGFGGELTVSAIQFKGTDQFRISDEPGAYPYVEVMADADIPRPVAQVGIGDTLDLSIEALPEHDADVLGVVCYGDIADAACTELFDLPIHRATHVGRLGQHYIFAADAWPSTSYASLNAIVDQFEEMLAADLDVSADFASAVPEAAGATGTPEAETRLIRHAMGETTVPAAPERVVVLDDGPLNSALALGVRPVGAATAFAEGAFPSYLAERTAGIEAVGTIEQPNLEAIAELRPDLILGSKVRHEAIYPALSRLAPTVFSERVGEPWKENLLLDGEALGKRSEAEWLLTEYEARLTAFREAMGDRLAATEVSVVRFLPDEVRIYQKATFSGVILEDAGLPRPEAQAVDDFAVIGASKELIALMDGDVMFVTTWGPAAETPLAEFQGDPLWSTLDVVESGRVYGVPDEYWMVGTGIIAANLVVDDLERYLLDGDGAATPVA